MHCFIGAEDPFLGFDEPIDAADSKLLGTVPLHHNDNQLPFPQIPDGKQLLPTAASTPQPIFIQVDFPDYCCCNKSWYELLQTDDMFSINNI